MRYARAWVHPLLGDIPTSKDLAVPKQPIVPLEFTTMTTNLVNLTPEDQFLSWCQEIEARQEEQSRQMVELREQANWLREENEPLRTHMETGRAGQFWEPYHSFPPSRPDKGKQAATPEDVDLLADDELSSRSSPFPHHSPSPNAAEAHSKKRSPRRDSRSIKALDAERTQQEPTTSNASSPICA